MKLEFQKRRPRRNQFRGFSTMELLVVMAVGTILTAVALPSFMRAYRNYQLNDAANRVAGVLKYTHYEAIRLNVPLLTPLKARISNTQTQAGVYVFCDSNNNSTVVSTDKQVLFTGQVTGFPPALLQTPGDWPRPWALRASLTFLPQVVPFPSISGGPFRRRRSA